MYRITDQQIDFILDDIKARGVVLEDLQDNLLDHMCCIIEDEMPDGGDFDEFYKGLLPRFFKKELKEIQEETDNLLTFKNYFAMRNTLKISGIASAVLMLTGSLLKTLHQPGAGITILLGGLIFSAIFMPLMIILKFKDEERQTDKWVSALGFVLGIAAMAGVTFRLMHWPFANILMIGSIGSFTFGYVPLYYITRYRRVEGRFNTTVNAVLMVATGGMLFALMNLNHSNKLSDSIFTSQEFLFEQTAELIHTNGEMYEQLNQNQEIQSFHKVSGEILEQIESIKVNLISTIEHVSKQEAAVMKLGELRYRNDHHNVKRLFVEGSGAYSLDELRNGLRDYNNELLELDFNYSKPLPVNKLDMENTMLWLTLINLTQLQKQIAVNEYGYLNSELEQVREVPSLKAAL